MTVIVCVDDNMGMRFNGRRQSRDRAVIERVLRLADGQPLYCAGDSVKLFPDPGRLSVTDELSGVEGLGVCFAERAGDIPGCFDRVVVYRWNRVYPSDEVCPIGLSAMRPAGSERFTGHSHEEITEENYEVL